jgi:small-conductance mechanosensitive channel
MMQRVLDYIAKQWVSLLWPAGLFVGVVVAGWAFRRILFKRLRRWTASTSTQMDDVVVDSLHGPFLLWMVILGIYVATEFSELPRAFTNWSEKLLLALWIISLTLVLSRLSGRLVRMYGNRLEGSLPMGTLMQVLATLVVGLLGLLTLLDAFNVSLRGILGALGVGGLAVALALQDTLSNFFAGFYVSLARQIRLGDFIKLDSGQIGYVIDISWRSTTLREPSNNLIVIPNNKLAQSIVTNYSLPERRVASQVGVGVSYDADASHVEQVLSDIASAAIGQVPGLLKEPAPSVQLNPGFGDSALNFSVGFSVAEYNDQYLVQHELRKRILRRFKEEGIEIPYPTRTVEFREPNAIQPPMNSDKR